MFHQVYSVQGKVERFPQKGGWYFVRVSKKITDELQPYADRGLVAITIQIQDTHWNSSLLPMGDGTQFIALPAKVRAAQNLESGDQVSLTFTGRER